MRLIFVLRAALICGDVVAAQAIATRNDAENIGSSRWRWTIYLVANPTVLNRIECVEYVLHRTFPNPVQRVCQLGNPRTPFALTAAGWGTFVVRVRVFFRNGETQDLEHQLVFR